MGRLIIVSNRLPVNIQKTSDGLDFQPSVGGLATGIKSYCENNESLWIGWPGIPSEELNQKEMAEVRTKLKDLNCVPVFLKQQQINEYYYGFCNKTIWPLFHYFTLYSQFNNQLWKVYKEVNEIYNRVVNRVARADDTIWVHDYQLLLLPNLLRQKHRRSKIGFFLHIPFPSFELIRLLPWRNEILEGILGADMVGFHEYDYVRHFLSSVHRITGYEHTLSDIAVDNRLVRVDAFPMGIEFDKFAHASEKEEVQGHMKDFRKQLGDKKIIISIDRLDYTKGILTRLRAYESFLKKYPEYQGKVSMVVVAVPSRTKVASYQELKEDIERLVGRINGEYTRIGWTPISYLYRSLPFPELVALYNLADVALITPLRDGMNLIAKEYVATQIDRDDPGMLILSEMAGAANELAEAIRINPHNNEQIVDSIKDALDMEEDDKKRRIRLMKTRIQRYTVKRWAEDFMSSLDNIKEKQHSLYYSKLTNKHRTKIFSSFKKAEKRLFLLDYDGTLVGFSNKPDAAVPDQRLYQQIDDIIKDEKNELVLISGRDKVTLGEWFKGCKINIIGEHGGWFRDKQGNWESKEALPQNWKQAIFPILELFTDRTPGSMIEEKDFSLVWHYRNCEPALAQVRIQELKDAILGLTANYNIGVFEGNKILEIKRTGINKGSAVEYFLNKADWDFIFAAGDDYTDEYMFSVLPKDAVSVKVGLGASEANYSVGEAQEVRAMLDGFIKREKIKAER